MPSERRGFGKYDLLALGNQPESIITRPKALSDDLCSQYPSQMNESNLLVVADNWPKKGSPRC